jgi:hypothetical protein
MTDAMRIQVDACPAWCIARGLSGIKTAWQQEPTMRALTAWRSAARGTAFRVRLSIMVTRRQFGAASLAVGGPALFHGCTQQAVVTPYEDAVRDLWRHGTVDGGSAAAVRRELVRYATLAPSSHNTQCWRFGIELHAITILPDLARRCPAVDPDDHHLFVSLGCAAENLVHAARAHGLAASATFDGARDALRIALEPSAAQASPLFSRRSRSVNPRAPNTTVGRSRATICVRSKGQRPATGCS